MSRVLKPMQSRSVYPSISSRSISAIGTAVVSSAKLTINNISDNDKSTNTTCTLPEHIYPTS